MSKNRILSADICTLPYINRQQTTGLEFMVQITEQSSYSGMLPVSLLHEIQCPVFLTILMMDFGLVYDV